MKRTFLAIILGLGLVACEETGRAETDEKPTPKAPYLAAIPDYGHWVVTFKYEQQPATDGTDGGAKSPSAPEGAPTVIDTIKTGDLRGVVLTYANGTTKEFTCQGDWILLSTPKGPQLSVASPSHSPYSFYTAGFVLLDGVTINLSTFKEAAKHNGALAFHYKSGEVDVWIDIATMLPLTVKRADIEVAYQFLPPPPRPFLIPTDQAVLLKKELEADKKVRSLR